MKKFRVIVVDDQKEIREGLKTWLSYDYEVVCFESAESVMEALNKYAFEDGIATCILLDLQMPNISGTELQRKLKLANVHYPIIFISGNANQADIIEAWNGGAVAFILKPFSASQISQSLKNLFDSISEEELQIIGHPKSNQDDPAIPLTPREAQVLLLLGKGHQQLEVAKILGISVSTVKMYRTFIKNKIYLNTQTELVRFFDKHADSIGSIANRKK